MSWAWTMRDIMTARLPRLKLIPLPPHDPRQQQMYPLPPLCGCLRERTGIGVIGATTAGSPPP